MEVVVRKKEDFPQVKNALLKMGFFAHEIGDLKGSSFSIATPIKEAINLILEIEGIVEVRSNIDETRQTFCPALDD